MKLNVYSDEVSIRSSRASFWFRTDLPYLSALVLNITFTFVFSSVYTIWLSYLG